MKLAEPSALHFHFQELPALRAGPCLPSALPNRKHIMCMAFVHAA